MKPEIYFELKVGEQLMTLSPDQLQSVKNILGAHDHYNRDQETKCDGQYVTLNQFEN
jgi:hypothetical protein